MADSNQGTPSEGVASSDASAKTDGSANPENQVTVLVWHVGPASLSKPEEEKAERQIKSTFSDTEFSPELIAFGTTKLGSDPELHGEGRLDRKVGKTASCIVVVHSPVSPDSEEQDFHPHLNLSLEGRLHDRDEVSACFASTIRTIWDHAAKVTDMAIVFFGRNMSEEGKRNFDDARSSAIDKSPKNQHLGQVYLAGSWSALQAHMVQNFATTIQLGSKRRGSFASVILAFAVGFVFGVWAAGGSPETEASEPVETIRVEPELVSGPGHLDYMQVKRWVPAHLTFTKDERAYICLLAGYDESASYWLCPIPDNWSDPRYKEQMDRDWPTAKIVSFEIPEQTSPHVRSENPPVQVLARLSDHLLIAYWGELLEDHPEESERFIEFQFDGADEVQLDQRNATSTKRLLELFPGLTPDNEKQ